MTDKLVEAPFRLAFRSEGDFVNVYFADIGTLKDSIHLASIRKTFVEAHPAGFELFKDLMKKLFSCHVENVLGETPLMPERPAPEDERSGNA